MSKVQNIALSSLIVEAIPLPIGGESSFASFVPDARYVVQRSLSGEAIFSKVRKPFGILTITVYPTDRANDILRGLVNADDARGGVGVIGGVMTDSVGTKVRWSGGKITQEAPVNIEENASVVAYTVTCSEFTIVKVPS